MAKQTIGEIVKAEMASGKTRAQAMTVAFKTWRAGNVKVKPKKKRKSRAQLG